ncbi:amidohydrolase [Aureimonas fodinaquatilis]|uniref:Amidohydrolase n=1 Tax=Aureimonas fodinaquatilis TaxID=2565783 RepID=A0A5B0E2C5_9HYPH|nr:amidohydrolase family protein [Aureimonas fodinaquatilis]KAA0971890.1 amidohydrolase [Aureimonas fodinaquatilis]
MTDIWNSYGETAGRRHVKTARPKGQTIDIHSHVAIPAANKIVEGHLDLATIPLAHFSSEVTTAVNQMQERDRGPNMTQYEARLADMDAAGVDMQLIMPPPGQCFTTVRADIASKAARVVNEGLAEYVSRYPDRFTALGTVTLQDGDLAAEELEYVMKLGHKGVQILTNVAGNEISDPAYAPFWAKAEELGAVVLLHPNGFTEGRRLARHYFNNVIGNPLETTLAISDLIFDGVMERYPKLKVIVVHGGGYLGGYSARMDHAWNARSDVKVVPQAPTTYLKRMYFDTVVFSNEQLEALVRTIGADHVLMGTDYPFDMAESDPVGHVMGAALDDDVKEAICGGNARRLLGL